VVPDLLANKKEDEMKHTVIHGNIDGYECVAGFGEAAVDPVATWAAIQDKILALDIVAQMRAVNSKIAAQRKLAADQWALAVQAHDAGLALQEEAATKAYQAANAQIPILEAELAPLAARFEEERSAMFEEHAIYSIPGPSESIIEDADYARLSGLHKGLSEYQRLTVAGEIVDDYRGVVYWKKSGSRWEMGLVTELAKKLPAGSVMEDRLSDMQKLEIGAQVESGRVAGLSPELKAAEKASVLGAAAQEAANKKALAEITGETFDAAAWYAARKAEIEKKYA
jgi:hypothetical protein